MALSLPLVAYVVTRGIVSDAPPDTVKLVEFMFVSAERLIVPEFVIETDELVSAVGVPHRILPSVTATARRLSEEGTAGMLTTDPEPLAVMCREFVPVEMLLTAGSSRSPPFWAWSVRSFPESVMEVRLGNWSLEEALLACQVAEPREVVEKTVAGIVRVAPLVAVKLVEVIVVSEEVSMVPAVSSVSDEAVSDVGWPQSRVPPVCTDTSRCESGELPSRGTYSRAPDSGRLEVQLFKPRAVEGESAEKGRLQIAARGGLKGVVGSVEIQGSKRRQVDLGRSAVGIGVEIAKDAA